MKLIIMVLMLLMSWLSAPLYTAQDRRYPVDPQTK